MGPSGGEERVAALHETRSHYEATQTGLMGWLRLILFIVGLIVVVLFLRAFFDSEGEKAAEKPKLSILATSYHSVMNFLFGETGKAPQARLVRTADGRIAEAEARPKARAEGEKEKEGFWASLLPSFGCRGWRDLQEKMKNQKFSVRHYLPELPSTEAIRANPSRFNISLAEMNKRSAAEIRAEHPPEEVLRNLAAIAGFHDQDPRAALSRDNEKAQSAERSMSEPEQAEMQVKLADTVGSYRSLLGKRQKLTELRGRVQDSLAALNECEEGERDLQSEFARLKNEDDDLRRQLSGLEQAERDLHAKIQQKERNLSEANKRSREVMAALTARLAELKAASGRKASIELDVQARLRKITAIDVEVDKLRSGETGIEAQIEKLQKSLDAVPASQRRLRDKLKLAKDSHESFERKRTILLTHKDLKEKLLKLVPHAEKTKDLADKFNETIEKEKSLKELAERISANPNEIQIIDDFIKEDKEIFHTWMKLFNEMEKEVNKFEGGEAYITIIERSLTQAKENIGDLLKQLAQGETDEKAFAQELQRLQGQLAASREKLKGLGEERTALNEWVENHRRLIANSDRDLRALEDEIASQQSSNQQERQSLVANFGNVDQERSALLESLSSVRGKMNDNQLNIKSVDAKLDRSKSNCAALKAFYIKTVEVLPLLESTLGADRRTLAGLKEEIQRHLEPFNAL